MKGAPAPFFMQQGNTMEKVATFIDGAYLSKLQEREFDRASIDMEKLAIELARGNSILRTSFYDCPPYQSNPATPEEKLRHANKERFFHRLSSLPRYQVRKGRLAFRGKKASGEPIFQQKGVDIMLGVDMVELSATHQITQAVLVAGDSDFNPAVEAVKRNGVLVVLYHGPIRGWSKRGTVHRELWQACDDRVEITQELIDKVRR